MFPSLNDTARLDFDLTWRSIIFYAILDSVLRIGFAKSILLLPPSGPSREKQNDKKNSQQRWTFFFGDVCRNKDIHDMRSFKFDTI